MLLLITMLLSISITAFAAMANDYCYYWLNSNVTRNSFGLTESDFKKTDFYLDNKADYEDRYIDYVSAPALSYYTRQSGKMKELRWILYQGKSVYNMNAKEVLSNLKSESQDYIVYDVNGWLYAIDLKDRLLRSKDNGTTWEVLLSSGATKLLRDGNDIGTKVQTTSGTKTLSSLTPTSDSSGSTSGTSPVDKSTGNYVLEFNNTKGHVFQLFENDKLRNEIISDGSYIYADGQEVTEDSVGPKFIGWDTYYDMYFMELDGTIVKYYEDRYGYWKYDGKATLSGNIERFRYNDQGFLTKIETSTKTYNIGSISFTR